MRAHSIFKRAFPVLALGSLLGSLLLVSTFGGCVVLVVGLYTLERSWAFWCRRQAARLFLPTSEISRKPTGYQAIDLASYVQYRGQNAKQADRMTGLLLEGTMFESEVA